MKLHNVKISPKAYAWSNEESELDEWDIKKLEETHIREAWYWYHQGSYEGDGEILLQHENGQWALWDMGHCSCYGPLGDGDFYPIWFDSLDELKEKFTDEMNERTDALFSAVASPNPNPTPPELRIQIIEVTEDGPELKMTGGMYPLSGGDIVVKVDEFSQVIVEKAVSEVTDFLLKLRERKKE